MAVDAELKKPAIAVRRAARRPAYLTRVTVPLRRFLGHHIFSSLTRRILFLNLAGLFALMIGILYLSQFRAGLIDARRESLLVQGEIIAAAISASTAADPDNTTIDLDRLLSLSR